MATGTPRPALAARSPAVFVLPKPFGTGSGAAMTSQLGLCARSYLLAACSTLPVSTCTVSKNLSAHKVLHLSSFSHVLPSSNELLTVLLFLWSETAFKKPKKESWVLLCHQKLLFYCQILILTPAESLRSNGQPHGSLFWSSLIFTGVRIWPFPF